MGRKPPLSPDEQARIIQMIASGRDLMKIAEILQRDHRTVKKFMDTGKVERIKRSDCRKKACTPREMRKVKFVAARHPYLTSGEIFQRAGIAGVSRTTRCKLLRGLADVRAKLKRPLLTKKHKEARVVWAKKYLKQDFQSVIWTDECRATLDGPDAWRRGWLLKGHKPRVQVKRQAGGGGVMFWSAICGDKLIGPVRVPEGVKLNSVSYCELLNDNFLPWLDQQSGEVKSKLVFMQDNAPSHASRFTKHWLHEKGLSGDNYMDWPANSCDLNPIEQLWAQIKQHVYAGKRQYNSLNELWRAICDACSQITPDQIKKLTMSVDGRQVRILENGGNHVK